MSAEDRALVARDDLDAFAALAAHQLGEAVALIRGAASVLELQQSALDPGGQDALRALHAGGKRAQRYVDDLLDVVRAGSEPEVPVAAELDPAFDAAAAELDDVLQRVPVQLQREPLPRAAIDPREAQRLFAHLLRSALAAGATRLGLDGRTDGDRVIVEMYDNGTPTGADAQPFAAFARPRGRGPLVGAGVSLPVCRRLCERRGGHIAMDARSDGATVVTVDLPGAP